MKRSLVLAYGTTCYVLFLGVFLYLIGFVENVGVPKTVDSGAGGGSFFLNLALIALFGLQHTVMARAGFKRLLVRYLPPAIERSTFVLVTVGVLVLLFRFWTPIPAVVWNFEHAALRALLLGISAVGWGLVLLSTFLINHFDLFGLRQVWLAFRGKPYAPLAFKKTLLYRWVRHPLMLGFLIAFWSTPTMTVGHLLFTMAFTGYIFLGVTVEERELVRIHGESYRRYQETTNKLFPPICGCRNETVFETMHVNG